LVPAPSRADRGTARLRTGGVVSGQIEIYVPGQRIVIRTDSGEAIALDIRELVELEIVPELPPTPPPVQEVPPTTTYLVIPDYRASGSHYAPPAGYQLQESPAARTDAPGRRPGLFWPLATLAGSAAVFIGGTMVLTGAAWACDGYYYDGVTSCSAATRQRIGGGVMMGVSLPLVVLAATYLLPRKVRARRRHRAAVRAYQLSLTPTLDPVAGRYGLGASVRF
jgi:hypothetical protein